jgi:hypothetical protein
LVISDIEMLQQAQTNWRKRAIEDSDAWDEEFGAEVELLAEKDD